MAEHWGIVGGGILGLRLAQRLRQQGHAVTILEAGPVPGGLAAAWTLGDIVWDQHYHVILLSDHNVQQLLADLDLSQEFVGVETKTGFYTDGRLYSMSNSMEFLRFPPLGLISKIRLAMTIIRASRITDWKSLERISVVDWLTRWSGRKTVEKIWIPLLRAKLGEVYPRASAAFIWAIIARMYAARRSGLKKEMFGYVRGGYDRILRRFVDVLTQSGVDFRVNARVSQIESTGSGPRVHLADGTTQEFDRVVVTAAVPAAKQMLPGLTAEEQKTLDGVTYQGIVCASLLLKKPLDRYYVTNITDSWVPFTAVIEMTALVDPAEFGGRSLVYLPKYVAPNDPLFEESDESIRSRFVAALQRMYPHFTPDDVLAFRLSRVRNVFAVSTLNYSEHVPGMETSLPGVYLVNSSQILNGTLNVNETLQLAEDATRRLLAEPAPVAAVPAGVAN